MAANARQANRRRPTPFLLSYRTLRLVDEAAIRRLAALVGTKNAADAAIAEVIGRPCQMGHVGEWIAAQVFDIELHSSATVEASDGVFRSGPLVGRSVNVKWYLKGEGILDLHVGAGPDLYLVMTGPRSPAGSSRGAVRPWVISTVYLFEHEPLVADLVGRGRKAGVASSVRRAVWAAAEIFPRSASPLLELKEDHRQMLSLFGPGASGLKTN